MVRELPGPRWLFDRRAAAAGADPLHQRVEGRREDQAKAGDAEHPAEDGGTQGLPHLGPCAGCDHQRRYTENEGERRHQDRSQSLPCRADRGVCWLAAGILRLTRELDDQNCILRCKPDQNHETDLREDVDGHVAEQQPGDGGEQTHRDDQHHRKRQLPALIICRQHQEDKERGGAEHQHRRRDLLLLLIGDLGPFEADAGR